MLKLKIVEECLVIKFSFSLSLFSLSPSLNDIAASAPMPQDGEVIYKDWVFINYTFKRFEGLTQRGTPTKK